MPIRTCGSPTVLKTEIDAARKKISLNETEDSWNVIAQGISHLTLLCNGGGCEASSDMVSGIRSMSRPLNNALRSERSRLSGTAVQLMTALAHGLGSSYEPLVPLFVPTLLDLCCRPNKVFASRARACIIAIIEHTQLPSLLTYLSDAATHKSSFLRLTAAEGLIACLNCFNPPDLEKEPRARMVEDFIRVAARDAHADVRKACKKIFDGYQTLMPTRVESFTTPLTPVVKKYLDIRTVATDLCADGHLGRQRPRRPPSRTDESQNTSAPSQRKVNSAQPPTDITKTAVQVQGRGPRVLHRAAPQMRPCAPSGSLSHSDGQSSSATQRPTAPARREKVQLPRVTVGILPSRAGTVPPARTGPQRPATMQMKFKASRNPAPEMTNTSGPRRVPLPLPEQSVQSKPGLQTNQSDIHTADVHTSNPRSRRDHEELSEEAVISYSSPESTQIVPPAASNNDVGVTMSTNAVRSRKLQKMVDEHTAEAVCGQPRTARGPKALVNGSGKCLDVSPELVP